MLTVLYSGTNPPPKFSEMSGTQTVADFAALDALWEDSDGFTIAYEDERGSKGYYTRRTVPASKPARLSKTAFKSTCETAWTDPDAAPPVYGDAEFQLLMEAFRDADAATYGATTAARLRAVFTQYEAADVFSKTVAMQLAQLAVDVGLMSQARKDAVDAAWPEK